MIVCSCLYGNLAADPAYAVLCALSQNACAVSAVKSYAVRRALLNYKSLLVEFSEEELLELPAWWKMPSAWAARAFESAVYFARSQEPHLRGMVSEFEG